MSARRRVAIVATAVVALAALGSSIGWAVTRSNGAAFGSGYGHGWMMTRPAGERTAWYLEGSGPVSDIAGARVQARRFADRLGLKTGEVMQFANNFYVLLEEKNGTPASELLVDPRSGDVTLEYGPAMMWNTRYGMMRGGYGGMMGGGYGGMMGRYGASANWTPSRRSVAGPLSAAQAETLADEWLAGQGAGLTAGEPDALPGYYTFHTLKDGKITGMLSVNEQTGAVWYHWWHGRFIAMEE